MEHFLSGEVQRKLAAENVSDCQSKVNHRLTIKTVTVLHIEALIIFCSLKKYIRDSLELMIFHEPAQVRQIPGKVLFSSSAEISKVCELKAAERLFLLLKLSTPEPLLTKANKGRVQSQTQGQCITDRMNPKLAE